MQLWEEKLGLRKPFAGNAATQWGTRQEPIALERCAAKNLSSNMTILVKQCASIGHCLGGCHLSVQWFRWALLLLA